MNKNKIEHWSKNKDITENEGEMLQALEAMALQYLEHKGEMNHSFMSAGESCLHMLEKYGIVSGGDPIYKFTERSDYYEKRRMN